MRKNKFQKKTDDSESEPWYYKPVAQTDEACGKPLAGETAESISSAFQKSQNSKEATISHTEAVYDMVREINGRTSEDLDVNVAIW